MLLSGVLLSASGCCYFGYGLGCASYFGGPGCGCGIDAGCCDPCGCEPSCGCDVGYACEPGCGCDVGYCEPSCGCDAGYCEPSCGCHVGCGCGPVCDCGPVCACEPTCGCEPVCEPACGCGDGCGGGCDCCGPCDGRCGGCAPLGPCGWNGWGTDWQAIRAGWVECCPLLKPSMWGACQSGCSGCGEVYVGEWISDPPACCDPCPSTCGGGNCARTCVGAKVRGEATNHFARRKEDFIRKGWCDTGGCPQHGSVYAGPGGECQQCQKASPRPPSYVRQQRGPVSNHRRRPAAGPSIGNVIQAAFYR